MLSPPGLSVGRLRFLHKAVKREVSIEEMFIFLLFLETLGNRGRWLTHKEAYFLFLPFSTKSAICDCR